MLDANTLIKLADAASDFSPNTLKSKYEVVLQAAAPMMLVIAAKGGRTSDIFDLLKESGIEPTVPKAAIGTFMRTRLKPLVDHLQYRSVTPTVGEAIGIMSTIRDTVLKTCPAPSSADLYDVSLLPPEFVAKHLDFMADNPTVSSSVFAEDERPGQHNSARKSAPSREPAPKQEASVSKPAAPSKEPAPKPETKPPVKQEPKPPVETQTPKPKKSEPVESLADELPGDDSERKAIAAAEKLAARDQRSRRNYTRSSMLKDRIKSPDPVSWSEFLSILSDSGIPTAAPRNALVKEGYISDVQRGQPVCLNEHELFIGLEVGEPVVWANLKVKPSAINFVRIFGE